MEEVETLLRQTNIPAKVRAYLRGLRRTSTERNQKRGQLDRTQLHRAVLGDKRVFTSHTERVLPNSAVSILVDCSGSMYGRKYYQACASAIMLAEALQGCGAKLEVAGFTELSHGSMEEALVHDYWTRFGQRVNRRFMLDRMRHMRWYGLKNNADGENLVIAYQRLKAQPEARKVLIILSDGLPAAHGLAYSQSVVEDFTRQVIKEIEADKHVSLFSIGIEMAETGMYRNQQHVGKAKDLPGALLALVKQALVPQAGEA